MKKIQKLLLLLMIGVLPPLAKASQISFDATVTEEKGLKYCDDLKLTSNCKKLEKGTKILVNKMDESDNYTIWLNDENYYIESKGFKPVEDEVKYNYSTVVDRYDANKAVLGENAITRKEVVLRKGPDVSFSTITTIPAGTKLSFRYYDYEDGVTATPTQIFVNYNGQNGWVECSNEKVLFYTYDIAYANLTETKTTNYIIPKYTYLLDEGFTDLYDYLNYEGDYIGIDYKSDRVWQAVKPYVVVATKELTLYDDINKTKVIKTVKPGEEFTVITDSDDENYRLHLVDVDGVKGIMSFNSFSDNVPFDYSDKDVDYKAIGLGKYLELYNYNEWMKEQENKEDKKEEKKDNRNTTTIIIVSSIVFALIMGAIFFIIKK